MEVSAQKAAIRRGMLQRLRTLGAGERQERSERLGREVSRLPCWPAAQNVLLFSPLPTEPEVNLLWSAGLLAGKRCGYPRVQGDQLAFFTVDDPARLKPGQWSLLEPVAEEACRVEPTDFDVILTPGLAFTSSGKRLGRGGGYYDRLFARCGARPMKVGVAFAFQLLPDLPVENHDVAMDIVVTDRGEIDGP